MSNIKGLTVEINGDTQPLTSAINKLDNPLKSSKKELKEIDRLLKMDPDNTELLAQRQQVLAQAVQQAKSKLDALKTAEKQAQEQFARGDIGEEQMRALQRAVIKAEGELKDLEKQAKETGEETKDGADKGKKGLEKMGKEGKDAGEDVEKGGKKGKEGLDKTADAAEKAENKLKGLKAAGQIVGTALTAAFTAAAATGVTLVKELAEMTVGAGEYADTILTEAQVTGMSTEQLQAYHYAAEQLDTSLETVTRSQTKNLKSMQSAAKGTGDVAEAYKELGVDALDPVTGKMRDANTVYWETIDALGKIEDDTKRDSLAMTLLGKSAKELNPLIEAGSEGLARLTDEAHKMGAVMSDETLEELANLDDSMQRLKSGGEALKNQLGTVLRPELQGFVDGLNDLLGRMTTGIEEADGDWDKISEIIADGSDEAAAMLAEFIPRIVETVGNGILAIGNGILAKAPELLAAFEKVAERALELAPKIVETAVQLIQKLAQGIAKNAGKIVAAAKDIVFSLLKGITQMSPDVIKAASSLISELIKEFTNPKTIVELVKVGAELAYNIIDGLIEGIGDISTAVVQAFIPFETAAERAASKAQEAAASVTPFADAIKNAVATANVDKLLDAYGNSVGSIEATIDEKEQAIRDIIAERLGEQQALRDEDLEHIRGYLNDLAELENQKLGIYQNRQESAKKKTELDTDMTREEGAQHIAESANALADTLAAIDDVYADRLTKVENLHNAGAKGYKTDEEYAARLEEEAAWYEEQRATAHQTYNETVALVNDVSKTWMGDTSQGFAQAATNVSAWAGGDLQNWATGIIPSTWFGMDTAKGKSIEGYISDLSSLDINAANSFLQTSAMRAQNGERLDDNTQAMIRDILSPFQNLDDDFDEAARPVFDSLVAGLQEVIPGLQNAASMTTDEIVSTINDYLTDTDHGGGDFSETEADQGTAALQNTISDMEAADRADNALILTGLSDAADATKTGNQKLDSILAAVNGLNLTLVLDDGTVIARTIGRIDAGLGERSKNDQRGSFD